MTGHSAQDSEAHAPNEHAGQIRIKIKITNTIQSRPGPSIHHGVGKDIDVDPDRVADFIAAAAAATNGVLDVVEALLGINEDEPPVEFEPFERPPACRVCRSGGGSG